ncbi:MAG: hypothetical protein ACTHZX_08415 [Microbacterium sp.]
MAVGRLSETIAASRRRWIAWPTWARILVVYGVARLVTTGLVLLASALAPSPSQLGSAHPLADFTLGWDAQWYWLVSVDGYPSELPHDPAGYVSQNAWAFMPVYAYVSRGIGFVFGDTWGIGAFLVSLVSGYLACLALDALIRIRQGSGEAMWATTFFAFGPLAGLFHIGYAESTFLALLLAALLCVARRRWGWLYLLVPVMGFTRPGILPFALMLAMYGIWRWMRRRTDPLPMLERVHIVALGLLSAAIGFAWQVIAALVTGSGSAYLDTELAWRRAWVGTEHFVPLGGWFDAADVWFGIWGWPAGAAALAVVALIVGSAALVLLPRSVRRIGPELRMWSASYIVYLFLVFFPQSSIFRLLAPLVPLSGAAAALRVPGVRTRTIRLGVLGLCLVGQWAWIWFMYGHGSTYWQVP